MIQDKLAGLNPARDAMGNITVTFGSGAPHRLIAAPIDEPGYVVSKIDDDGYLRVQKLPQSGLPPHFNELQNTQPMEIVTRGGKLLSGIVAGLSIHLEPGRSTPPDPDDIDNLYVDMGAANADDVRHVGVDLLSPMAAERRLWPVGTTQWSATAVGDRFGAAVLLSLAHSLAASHMQGSVTLAFVVQQWSGARGLTRVLESQHPDELIYIGRPLPKLNRPGTGQADTKSNAETEVYRAKARFRRVGLWRRAVTG